MLERIFPARRHDRRAVGTPDELEIEGLGAGRRYDQS